MTLLSGLGVNELTSPELTGEWEHRLKQIEQRQLDRDELMREIAQMTQVIVKRAKEYERDTVPGDYARLRSDEHTSELQTLMLNQYTVLRLKQKQNNYQ